MSDRTPVEQLSGLVLCERTAEAMGWKRKARMDNEYGKWWTDKNGKDRRIRSDAPYECSFDFRPDLDGNHLAEVIEEAHKRGWEWSFTCVRPSQPHMRGTWPDGGGCAIVIPRRIRPSGTLGDRFYSPGQFGSIFNEAFLRAFVAASEAEREAGT